MFRLLLPTTAQPEEVRCSAAGIPAHELPCVRRTRGRRCRRSAARAPTVARRGVDGAALRSGPIGEADAGRRDAGNAEPAIRAAVERSLPLLQDVGVAFIEQTGCVSCHHNSVVSMAVAAARAHGYTVNEAIAARRPARSAPISSRGASATVQNIPIAGAVDTISYLLFGLAADTIRPMPRPMRRRSS